MFLNEQMFTNINTEFVLRVLKYGFNIKICFIYIKKGFNKIKGSLWTTQSTIKLPFILCSVIQGNELLFIH